MNDFERVESAHGEVEKDVQEPLVLKPIVLEHFKSTEWANNFG